MRVLLVTPPLGSVFYPSLSLPSLASFIRSNSNHKCFIADLSIEAVRHILTIEFLDNCKNSLQRTLDKTWMMESLNYNQQNEYFRVVQALIKADPTIDTLTHTVDTFKNLKYLRNWKRRQQAVRTLDNAFEIVSAAYWPFEVTRDEVKCGSAPFESEGVITCLENWKSPFCSYIEHRVEELFSSFSPEVVGISINYYSQLLIGLETLTYIRKKHPRIKLIVGGGLMPEIGVQLATRSSFKNLMDFVVCYEGETALLNLLDILEHNANLESFWKNDSCVSKVPNLIDSRKSAQITKRHREDIRKLPAPDFSDLRLHDYLSPGLVLPLLTSRGCYWGKCAFCTHSNTYGKDYRTLKPTHLVDHIEFLIKKHDCRQFYFVDESLAPSKAKRIATEIITRKIQISWGTEIRFEKALENDVLSLMAKSGCRVLSFGLESGSQRVLDLMDKGIKLEDVDRILTTMTGYDIFAHVMCIIGFPSETRKDIDSTINLIRKHQDRIAIVGFSPFTLNKNSVVEKQPTRFGLKVFPTDIFRPAQNFQVSSGISQVEALSLYDDLMESKLLINIDFKSSVATREHLIFITKSDLAQIGDYAKRIARLDEERPNNEDKITNLVLDCDGVEFLSLPFSLNLAAMGRNAVKARQRNRIFGLGQPKFPSNLVRGNSVVVAYIKKTGRTLELSEDLYGFIRRFEDNSDIELDDTEKPIAQKLANVGFFSKKEQ